MLLWHLQGRLLQQPESILLHLMYETARLPYSARQGPNLSSFGNIKFGTKQKDVWPSSHLIR